MLNLEILISNPMFKKLWLSADMYGFIAISVSIILMMTLITFFKQAK